MKQSTLTIIGGGASGMAAAITAARMGSKVRLIEQKEKPGKKILSTGNGRCNFTNLSMGPDFFRGDDTSITEIVMEEFGVRQTLKFFGSMGLLSRDRDGYVYPRSNQASAVQSVMLMELQKLNVELMTGTKALQAKCRGHKFTVKTDHGQFESDALILACGGKAAPVLGSDGSGYVLAKSFGHTLSPVVPALTALKAEGFKKASGVRTDAMVTAVIDGKPEASDTGELQITNYGISGIPVFQISRYIAKALHAKQQAEVEIDYFPQMEEEDFKTFLYDRKVVHSGKTAEEFLVGIFPLKLIEMLLMKAGIKKYKKVSEISETEWARLIQKCRRERVTVTDTNSFDQAQVCAGGVRTSEIWPNTMESRIIDGLYLTGELLDIDGCCGGYNLQWAWSTGCLAGMYASKRRI